MNTTELKTEHRYRILLAVLLLVMAVLLSAVYWEVNSIDWETVVLTAPEPTPEPTPAPTPQPTPQPTPAPTPAPTPDPEELARIELFARQREEAELLTLVNASHPIDTDKVPELCDFEWYGEEMKVDVRCAEALRQMLLDCEAAGNIPWVCSAYRDYEYQQNLFDNKIMRVIYSGVRPSEAYGIAARSVAVPGTSEHHTGLAVDIVDYDQPDLTELQETTDTQKWLMEHCSEYGFILRYPNGTSELTGIIYEPWHYRYVGLTAAKEITERGTVLEEYIDYLESEGFFES